MAFKNNCRATLKEDLCNTGHVTLASRWLLTLENWVQF